MKKITLLLIGVFSLTLLSFTVQQKKNVVKLSKNLYEINDFKTLTKNDQETIYNYIEKQYDLTDLKKGVVNKLDLTMKKGVGTGVVSTILAQGVTLTYNIYQNFFVVDYVKGNVESVEIKKIQNILDKYTK